MWIYIPSELLPSVPDAGALTLLSESQSQELAQSCTWRTKSRLAAFWRGAWKRISWPGHLFGPTLSLSPGDRGAAISTWLSEGTPASHSPVLASDEAPTTHATSGQASSESSKKSSQSPASSRTSPPTSVWGSTKSTETFEDLVLKCVSESLRRRKWARRMFARGYSSWGGENVQQVETVDLLDRGAQGEEIRLVPTMREVTMGVQEGQLGEGRSGVLRFWPTPNVPHGGRCMNQEDFEAKGNTERGKRQVSLESATRFWPTPDASVAQDGETPGTWLARREKLKATHQNGNGCGTPLSMAAQLFGTPDISRRWPTPQARVAIWSTPRASDGEKGGPNQSFGAGGTPLPSQVARWPTPMAGESEKQASGKRDCLTDIARRWSGPAASDVRSGLCSQETAERNARPLSEFAVTMWDSTLPDPQTSTLGEPSLPTTPNSRRLLNPAFVGWLMTFPPGLTSCALQETEFASWLLRMRTALSAIRSEVRRREEAIPRQMSMIEFFGEA